METLIKKKDGGRKYDQCVSSENKMIQNFHQFSNQRRYISMIWEIKTDEGASLFSF